MRDESTPEQVQAPWPGSFRASWAHGEEVELAGVDRSVIDVVVEELGRWRHQKQSLAGTSIEVRWGSNRAEILIRADESIDYGRQLAVRISRSGAADAVMTLHFRPDGRCWVIDVMVLPV